jgi:hypothetical protein
MGETHTYLPRLTVNELFISDLMSARPPCFALGYVEDRGAKCGFIALRPEAPIPAVSTKQGFCFGHSVLGPRANPVLHFAFEFYGHATYHGLAPAGNPIIQAVINTMLETGDYFFFAINPDQTVTAFRSRLEEMDLSGLRTNQEEFGNATCAPEQYERAVKSFAKNPDPPGQVMEWVCRNNWDYLNITKYPLELTPRP